MNQEQLLDTEYLIYNFSTYNSEPGTIITHPDLAIIFDENKLFKMDNVNVKTIRLRDIIEKGFITIGSTDIMETLDITYPNPALNNKNKPTIKGKYIHGSRKELITYPTGIDFIYDPESEIEETHEFSEVED